jgi:pimeloyl-ACP methyl ester carboxylesterase
MKDGASRLFLPGGAGAETLAIWLTEMAHDNVARPNFHVCGHSTGAVLLAYLLETLEDLSPTLRIKTCSLFAPAATVGLFESHYFPYLVSPSDTFGIDRMRLFNLNDELERSDTVANGYQKSLLYLVSRAFEEEVPEAILGMQRHVDDLLRNPKMAAVGEGFDVHYADGTPDTPSMSTTHDGFDRDGATMNSLLRIILGTEPGHPVSMATLDG